jgi:hypothetical protein
MARIPLAAAIALMPLAAAGQTAEVAAPRIITLDGPVAGNPDTVTIHRGRARLDPGWQGVSGGVGADPACLPGAETIYPELPDILGGAPAQEP